MSVLGCSGKGRADLLASEDSDCWVIVGDQARHLLEDREGREATSSAEVLDVTAFLSEHPGGKKSIMMFAGKDATEE